MFVFIRGAGDLATGISVRLYRAGIKICHSDLAIPTAVRRNVAFSEAIRLGKTEVEGIEAVLAQSPEDVFRKMEEGKVPVVIDEGKEMLKKLKPYAVVEKSGNGNYGCECSHRRGAGIYRRRRLSCRDRK